jgi:hypothetical protein
VRVSYALPTVLTPSRELDYGAMMRPVPALLELGICDFRTMVRIPAGHDPAWATLTELRERFAQACG